MSYFSDLGLAEPILRALGTKGYGEPTPIQRQSIPALLEGRDLLGIAQTGTGKTAAFSLPSLHRLASDPQPRKSASCRMLVLSPTRELAAQIADNIRGYAKYLSLSVQCVFGGVPAPRQARALVPGCDVLVATPGRLLDLIDSRALTLRNVEIFVLDEADQMMDLGFIVPLKRIAGMLPEKRQSLFFSATMPQAIADLGRQFIHNPVRVEVAPQSTTAERVEQYATFINQAEKQALLSLRLREGLGDKSIDRALVFTRTKHGADRVVRHLTTAGVSSAAIHGNKSQGQRTAAINGFRSGHVPVLVATDIAARGIDIPGVSHVFNFELPNVPEQYVHRIGRTARAGADGIAMSFIAPDEKAYLRDIERLTGVKLTPMPLPEDFAKQAARLPAPSKKAIEAATRDSGTRSEGGRDQRQHRRGRGIAAERSDRRERPEGHRSEGRPQGRYSAVPNGGWNPANFGEGRERGEGRGEGRSEGRSNDGRQDRTLDRAHAPRRPHGEGARGPGERGHGGHGQGERRPHGDRAHSHGDRRAHGERPSRDGGREGQHRDGQNRDGQNRGERSAQPRDQQGQPGGFKRRFGNKPGGGQRQS